MAGLFVGAKEDSVREQTQTKTCSTIFSYSTIGLTKKVCSVLYFDKLLCSALDCTVLECIALGWGTDYQAAKLG